MLPTLTAVAPALCPIGYADTWKDRRCQHTRSGLGAPYPQSKQLQRIQSISYLRKQQFGALTCASSLNSRCAVETQTVKRESKTIPIIPIQGKAKTPKLDDGGTGNPPRDNDGGGGGGGGGPSSSGGFFLFGFLLFLSYLKDQEEEEYRNGIR